MEMLLIVGMMAAVAMLHLVIFGVAMVLNNYDTDCAYMFVMFVDIIVITMMWCLLTLKGQ